MTFVPAFVFISRYAMGKLLAVYLPSRRVCVVQKKCSISSIELSF